MTERTMAKLVLKPSEVVRGGFDDIDNLMTCYDCKSTLFYIKVEYGIVANENDFWTVGHRSKRDYTLREIGFAMYCAECGDFRENYGKFFYPADRLLMFDVLDTCDADEKAEIENCLTQFNQKGDFKTRYNSNIFKELKKSLVEYEKKHPIKK